MALIEDGFRIDSVLSFDDEVGVFHETFDPTVPTGQPAPIGSLFLRTDIGELYQKVGPTDTDWELKGSGGSATAQTPACVVVTRSANFTIPTTYTDVTWDQTLLETQPSIIEHSNSSIDDINILEDGLFIITYSLSVDAGNAETQFDIRVRKNTGGTITVLPGSPRTVSEDDEINDVSNVFYAELAAGDVLTLQSQADNGQVDVISTSSNFTVAKFSGARGAAGPAGTGSSINVQGGGVPVPNTPHNTINFIGASATDGGSGVANVTIDAPIFGSEFHKGESLSVSTTTSSTFQPKATTGPLTLPAGEYRIGVSYGWNHNSTGNDFEARIRQNGSTIGQRHKQEPKDSAGGFGSTGTSQKYVANRTLYRTLTTGTYTFDLQFRTDSAGTTSSIWDAVIEVWRVS